MVFTKLCKLCGKTYPWTSEYFHWWSKKINKLHVYCKPCKIAYVTAWKHHKPFIKIRRPMGVVRKRNLSIAGRAIKEFINSGISTEELFIQITPFFKDKTTSVVEKLRLQVGLPGKFERSV